MGLTRTPVQINMAKLRKFQVAEMKERMAIEVIDHAHAGILRSKEEERRMIEDNIIVITLKKLGYKSGDFGIKF